MDQNGKASDASRKCLNGVPILGTDSLQQIGCKYSVARLWRSFASAALIILSALFSISDANAFTLSEYKDFITNPPKEGRMVVEFVGASHLAEGGSSNALPTEYQFEWMNLDIRVRELAGHPDGARPIMPLAHESGSFNGQHWEYASNRLTLFDKDTNAGDESVGGRFVLQTILRLGIQHPVVPNSFVWDGVSFRAKLNIGGRQFGIKGRVELDSNVNYVVGLRYRWDDAEEMNYAIQYVYTDIKRESQFPSRLIVHGFGAVGDNPLMVATVREFLDVRSGRMAASSLDPITLFTNSQVVKLSNTGLKASFIPDDVKQPKLRAQRLLKGIVLIVLSVSGVVVLWLAFRSRLPPTNSR